MQHDIEHVRNERKKKEKTDKTIGPGMCKEIFFFQIRRMFEEGGVNECSVALLA